MVKTIPRFGQLLLVILTGSLFLGQCYCQDTGGPYTGTISVSHDQSSGSCIDNRGQVIQEGRLFEPGPDECQVCTCLRQLPVLCRTVLCAPPQGCRSLRVGDACCEWVCDKWDETSASVSDLGLRLMASAITAIFSLSLLFFLIYRLRQRKLRGRQNHLEAEGYSQDEVVDDVPGYSFHLDSMKPHDRIMMRRPFPPSYTEAMYGIQPPPNNNLGENSNMIFRIHFKQLFFSDVSTEHDAPPYNTIDQDPVISYPVATLGRLVLPSLDQEMTSSSSTLPSSVRRVLRIQANVGEELTENQSNRDAENSRGPPSLKDLSARISSSSSEPPLSSPRPCSSYTSPRPSASSISPSSSSTQCQSRTSSGESETELTQTTV